MFLLIDPTSPSELSSVPQPLTDLKNAAHPGPQPLKRIIQLSADIMDAADVCAVPSSIHALAHSSRCTYTQAMKANKERCLKLARLVGDRVSKICDIVRDRWDPAPHIIKSALDQLEA